MIYSVDVRVEAPVRETEVADRVADAVRTLFPTADVTIDPDRVVAEGHSLDHLSELLHDQEILDSARREFARHGGEDGFSFSLKKQAALQGVVNFAVGSPDELGEIQVHVTVRDPDVDAFVDYVAPPTEEGEPIDPADR